MTPVSATKDAVFGGPTGNLAVTLTATVDGHTVASTVVNRQTARTVGVTEQDKRPATDDPTPADAAASVFPVEKINGPVLVICGEGDLVWNSCDFSDAIIARLDADHDPFPHKELRYPEAGHFVGAAECCYSALPAFYAPLGGTVLGNARASEQAHSELMAYLAQLTVG